MSLSKTVFSKSFPWRTVFLLEEEEEEEEEAAAVDDIISNFKISKKNEKYIFKIKKKIQKKIRFLYFNFEPFLSINLIFLQKPL